MARTRYGARTPNCPSCRLYNTVTGKDLILDGASVQVLIADVHASVLISQRFINAMETTVSAVYTFGIMTDAAVCGFEMVRQDGTRLEGIVKEKDEAKKEYEKAIRNGKTASLGQQETADVFSISVGNIQAQETVTINLRYLQPLMDDEKKDQIKFIFPRAYAQRYGQAPTYNSAVATTAHQPFTMDVIVQQAGAIKSISCPSGLPISYAMGLPDGITPPSDNTSHFANISLSDSSGSLTQDVVLVVSAEGLDSPRCFAEPHPSPNHETTAMALTFVPRFTLPDVKGGMEYIFVVDRSGSMSGQNMKLVQEALVVLLRGLPSSETTFNIISFGYNATKLWNASRQYSQTSLEEATEHVDDMEANYGGTEIALALQLVFSSLQKPLIRPVSVILLTDGAAWDVHTCVSFTQTALSSLPKSDDPSSFIRVFTVGIGNGASSDTCDSIARAGEGMALYVKQGEPVVGKCARLVRAARTPPLSDVTVLWTGDEVEEKDAKEPDDEFEMVESPDKSDVSQAPTLSLLDHDDEMLEDQPTGPPPAPDPTLPPPPRVQQAPLALSNLFPGTRTQMYAIVNTPSHEKGVNTLPASIRVKGVVVTTRANVELVIPVSELLSFPFKAPNFDTDPDSPPKPFIHTLAAKALITDRQHGKHCFPVSVASDFENNPELKVAYMKKEIVRLGTTYQVISKYTSYIAVDHRLPEPDIIPVSILNTVATTQSRLNGSGKAARKQLAVDPRTLPDQVLIANEPAESSRPVYTRARSFKRKSLKKSPKESADPHPEPDIIPVSISNTVAANTQNRLIELAKAARMQLAVAPRTLPDRIPSSSTRARFVDIEAEVDDDEEDEVVEPPLPLRLSAKDLKGLDETYARVAAFDDSRVLKKRRKESSADASSSSLFSAPTKAVLDHNKDETPLTAIARLQQFNGSLSLSNALLILLGVQGSVQEIEDKLAGVGVSGDVGATVLTWVWMERWGGDEALDLVVKAMDWVKSEVGENQAVGIRERVLDVVSFGSSN